MLKVGQASLSEKARGSHLKGGSIIRETEEGDVGSIRIISTRNSDCDKLAEIS